VNEIVKQDVTAIQVTESEIEVARKTVADGASDAEFKLFLYDCQRLGVHPLDRMLHFTKRDGKYTPVVSIDLLRARADETGEYCGNDDAIFEEGEDAKYPKSACVIVRRMIGGQPCEFASTARWEEYCGGEKIAFMYRKMPRHMLAKCAEAQALRKAFPRKLSKLYINEEMPSESTAQKDDVKALPAQDETGQAVGEIEEIRAVNDKVSKIFVGGIGYATGQADKVAKAKAALTEGSRVKIGWVKRKGFIFADSLELVGDQELVP